MAGFADLKAKAQPALAGRGCLGECTEDGTWYWPFTGIVDDVGDDVDLSGTTGVAKVFTDDLSTEVVELDYTGAADGSFVLSLDEADTDGTATGALKAGRKCTWSLRVTDGTDVVWFWGAAQSRFVIYPVGT